MILEVENLNKSFRHPWNLKMMQVLHDVSFAIEKKSIVGFLGANGAGKTTSIKCLMGLLTYQSGKMQIFGQHHLNKAVKKKVGYLPERPYFYQYLTAKEFLRFYGELSGLSGVSLLQRIEEMLKLVGLSHARDSYLKQFSKGMLQRVGLAQAMIHRPQLLVLDEPLSGLDPDGRRQLVQIIQNTHDQEDTTIFFSSHLLDDVDRLCQDLVVIQKGHLKFNGAKNQFVQDSRPSYEVRFNEKGRVKTVKVESVDGLQNKIDQIRDGGAAILAVEQQRVSLDQAFKKFQQNEVER